MERDNVLNLPGVESGLPLPLAGDPGSPNFRNFFLLLFSGKGTIWLKVVATGIVVALVDHNAGSSSGTPVYNLGADCKLSDKLWNCGQYHDTEIREGVNFLRFGGSDKFHGVSPTLEGPVNQNCAQWSGSIKDTTVNGSWNEYRVGLLVKY